jgi:hypothetical protein
MQTFPIHRPASPLQRLEYGQFQEIMCLGFSQMSINVLKPVEKNFIQEVDTTCDFVGGLLNEVDSGG